VLRHAVITLIGAWVSVAWAPETRGLTLGESAALSSKTTVRSVAAA
jgi:MFS transporter, putative metabolite transport protein